MTVCWLVTEEKSSGYVYLLGVTAERDTAKRVAELDFYERVDSKLDWDDEDDDVSFAQAGKGRYVIREMEVMQ